MSREVRRRESLHYSAIYQYHPGFKDADFDIWTTGMSGADRSAEGGDIFILGGGKGWPWGSLKGLPPRVWNDLQSASSTPVRRATRVLAVMLPERREFMHLDTVLTQVDRDKFVIYPEVIGSPCVLLEWDANDEHIVVRAMPEDVPKASGSNSGAATPVHLA